MGSLILMAKKMEKKNAHGQSSTHGRLFVFDAVDPKGRSEEVGFVYFW